MSLSVSEWVAGIMIAVVMIFAICNLFDKPHRL